MMTKYYIIGALLMLVHACNKEDRYLDRLEGDWNIDRLTRTEIHADGTVLTLSDESDAGLLSLKVAELNGDLLENLKDYIFDFTENGTHVHEEGVLKVDEQAKRVILFGGACIQCDVAYTVEENKRNKQVWATFSYDAQKNVSYKLKLEMSK